MTAPNDAPVSDSTSPLWGEVGPKARVRGQKLSSSAVAKSRSLRRRETDAERKFWNAVRNRQVEDAKFVRQYAIGPYVADFVCREKMLVVELDGGQHAENANDAKRTNFLNSRGYSVLRFWNDDALTNLDGTIEALMLVLNDGPSPDLRFAPATLSPRGRGNEDIAAESTSPLRGEVGPKARVRGRSSNDPIFRDDKPTD